MNSKQIVLDDVLEPCEACGATAEIGYIVREDDLHAVVSINGADKAALLAEFELYLALAKTVNERVSYQLPELSDDATTLEVSLAFEFSAEKLIFELKSRTLHK